MEAIKQALQAMALQLLKEVGYGIDVKIEDSPIAGHFRVHLTKDKRHYCFTMQERYTLAEASDRLRNRIWEFNAYLSTKEGKPGYQEINLPPWRAEL